MLTVTELGELQKWQSEVLACEKNKLESLMAKSFDKLCEQMGKQADDMEYDMHAHGARELVAHDLAADNQKYTNKPIVRRD